MMPLTFALVAAAGFLVGYYIAWALDQAEAWLDAYLDGVADIALFPEMR